MMVRLVSRRVRTCKEAGIDRSKRDRDTTKQEKEGRKNIEQHTYWVEQNERTQRM
jgi:hypothetical protein